MAKADSGFWAGLIFLSALMILAYLALTHSGGLSTIEQGAAKDVGAVSTGGANVIRAFQGRS